MRYRTLSQKSPQSPILAVVTNWLLNNYKKVLPEAIFQ